MDLCSNIFEKIEISISIFSDIIMRDRAEFNPNLYFIKLPPNKIVDL